MSETKEQEQGQQNSQPEKTKKALFLGPVLLGIVTALVSVALYLIQFGPNGLSGDTHDWANFGSYLAGTLGVVLVGATLWAFIITLRQQQTLLEVQRAMLETQKQEMKATREELASTSRSNQQIAIYQSLDRLLPDFIDGFKTFVEPEDGSEFKGIVFDFIDHEKKYPLDDYWSDVFADEPSQSSEYWNYFGCFLHHCYSRAIPLVQYCVQVSKTDQNLRNYIYQSIYDFKGFLACVYAYAGRDTDSEQFKESMSFLLGVVDPDEIQYVASAVMWRKAVQNDFQKQSGSGKLCDTDGNVIDESMILQRLEVRDFSVF